MKYFKHIYLHQVEYKSEADVLEVIVLNCPVLHGDVKLRFQCSSVSLFSIELLNKILHFLCSKIQSNAFR